MSSRVGASVDHLATRQREVPEWGPKALRRLMSTEQRTKMMEAEGKARGYDLAAWRKVMMTHVSSCVTCAARPLVADGVLFVDADGVWVTNVCSECRTCIDPENKWLRLDEVPTEADWKGGMTMAEEHARKGQGLHRNVYHLNEHLLCKVRIMELNEIRDQEMDEYTRETYNQTLLEMFPPREEDIVPTQLSFTFEEQQMLAFFDIKVPLEPEPFCTKHAESKEEEHRQICHARAYRDGWSLVRDPFGDEEIYFRERTLQSATPEALLAKYRKEAVPDPDELVEDQDCKIPWIKGNFQPNLKPDLYHLRDGNREGVLHKHGALIAMQDFGDQNAQVKRAALWEKVFAAVNTPTVTCPEIKALGDEIEDCFTTTGLLMQRGPLPAGRGGGGWGGWS